MEVIKDIASLVLATLTSCVLVVIIWYAVGEIRQSKRFWEKMEEDENRFYKELKDEIAELDKEIASGKKEEE